MSKGYCLVLLSLIYGRCLPDLGRIVRKLLILILCYCLAPAALAQGEASEIEIKAAFLLKFPTYVEWLEVAAPAPGSPLRIGVVDDAIAASLERTAPGQTVNGHPLQIQRLQPWDNPEGLHVLFIGREHQDAAAMLLQEAVMIGVLTVTEAQDGVPPDSIINFLVVDDRVRFEIELDTAAYSGLRLSSRLLQIARNVIGSPP